ncbi:SMI1/KNR4 family protein [Amycolatopsis sp. NPDC059021]|uniref:SMI1/KNR4 family protein n=1 Tax=Amycolatopsis sp. NPDC059021 TaxID=3346704 RepID=UPI00366CFB59
MDPGEFLESAVRDVLTADEAVLDERIGYTALLLATAGAAPEADRLVTQWRTLTERPVTALAGSQVRARAWAMLFEARGTRPDWAEELPPLDLDAEERAHTASLLRPVSDLDSVLGDSPAASVVSGIAGKLAPSRPDKLRSAIAAHDLPGWATLAAEQARPDVAMLAASRALAPRLAAGADPLGLGAEWPSRCADALVAALYERYPPKIGTWAELISRILRFRGTGTAPAPATPAAIEAAELRLGLRLPDDYRDFLLTCDGLPGDVVFPRLLGTGELRVVDDVVVLAEPAIVLLARAGDRWHAVEVDPVFGSTAYPAFRVLLEHHLALLAQSA